MIVARLVRRRMETIRGRRVGKGLSIDTEAVDPNQSRVHTRSDYTTASSVRVFPHGFPLMIRRT